VTDVDGPRALVVVGAGSLARRIPGMLADLNRTKPVYRLLGFLDRPSVTGEGEGVIGDESRLATLVADYLICIANPRIRTRLGGYADGLGRQAATLVHPRANIEEGVTVGTGGLVMAGVCVNHNSTLGRHCVINSNAVIGHDCVLGDYTTLSPLVNIGGRVRVGPGVLFGASAVVLPELTVGEGAVIGAGAVVTRDVPPRVCAVGVPARWR
jgi:sugar O-acyltransferase (sialic acid O-acetyltransferase NeuD family)